MPDQEVTKQRLHRLESDITEMRDEALHVKEKVIEHSVRFGNGIKVMGELKQSIQDLQPKAPDWVKLLLAGMAIVGVLVGAQDRLNDRPTNDQVDQRVIPLQAAQKETAKEISEIEKSQSAQQTSIQNIEAVQTLQGKKLDNILDRLPKGGRRHR